MTIDWIGLLVNALGMGIALYLTLFSIHNTDKPTIEARKLLGAENKKFMYIGFLGLALAVVSPYAFHSGSDVAFGTMGLGMSAATAGFTGWLNVEGYGHEKAIRVSTIICFAIGFFALAMTVINTVGLALGIAVMAGLLTFLSSQMVISARRAKAKGAKA